MGHCKAINTFLTVKKFWALLRNTTQAKPTEHTKHNNATMVQENHATKRVAGKAYRLWAGRARQQPKLRAGWLAGGLRGLPGARGAGPGQAEGFFGCPFMESDIGSFVPVVTGKVHTLNSCAFPFSGSRIWAFVVCYCSYVFFGNHCLYRQLKHHLLRIV